MLSSIVSPALLGVILVDLTVDEMTSIEPDHEKLIDALSRRSRICLNPDVDECHLQVSSRAQLPFFFVPYPRDEMGRIVYVGPQST